MAKRLERFSVTIDSNEASRGKAWTFPGYNTYVQNLVKFGCDYSIKGQVGIVGIERKSYNDYVRCVGIDWKRFQKQLNKLMTNRFYAVVVEANIDDQINERSSMTHAAVVHQTGIITAHRIPVVFAGSRLKAANLCLSFFKQALVKIQDNT